MAYGMRWTAALAGALTFALGSVDPSVAQQISHPQPGSSERRDLMDAIRPLVVARVGSPVEFVVNDIRIVDDHAFVAVEPQRPGGQAIDFAHFDDGTLDGLHTEAILVRRNGRWQVISHSIGSSDVWYVAYCDAYPRGLIPTC